MGTTPTVEQLIANGLPRELAEHQVKFIRHKQEVAGHAHKLDARKHAPRRFHELVAGGYSEDAAEKRIRDEWVVSEADRRAKARL
jgi:hypothetical protein